MKKNIKQNASQLHIPSLGLATGSTFAILYLACVFVMNIASRDVVISFFNGVFHGIDVTSIIRMQMPWYEMLFGVVEVFILGWLTGATIASIYNFGSRRS